MNVSEAKLRRFREKVLSYYLSFGRTLPWRTTTDPYKILLSEIMLQQTQVDRVVEFYTRWFARWPTIQDLAKADRTDVLKMWLGLGYNNRAINLHKAVQKISKEYGGDVLAAVKNFKDIPGIGPYTSAAVQIFAKNADIVTVDTNIRRILIHEFNLPDSVSDKELWNLADQCLPKGRSRDWHNALMDYGATLLTARKTGIKPKTTQSTFEGSDRQIRSKILRHVLNAQPATFEELAKVVGVGMERLKKIVQGLVEDDVLFVDNKKFCVTH
ncbi:A/G-specific adenine glycosylase [Candidatus Woesearchaeota archaeon]|nr:A/G-specific adenine glycosylase [Candidatus Woesearchaeota archaeon]